MLGEIVVSGASKGALLAALQQGIEENNGKMMKCFEPRHGLRVVYDGKTIDFLICFECLQIEIFNGTNLESGVLVSSSPQALFDKLLRDANIPLAPKPGEDAPKPDSAPAK